MTFERNVRVNKSEEDKKKPADQLAGDQEMVFYREKNLHYAMSPFTFSLSPSNKCLFRRLFLLKQVYYSKY